MDQYTIEHRTKIIGFYFSNQRSIASTQRAYRQYFNVRIGPSESIINRLVENFQQEGSVINLPGEGRENGGTDTGAGKKRKSKGSKPVAKKKDTSDEDEDEEEEE